VEERTYNPKKRRAETSRKQSCAFLKLPELEKARVNYCEFFKVLEEKDNGNKVTKDHKNCKKTYLGRGWISGDVWRCKSANLARVHKWGGLIQGKLGKNLAEVERLLGKGNSREASKEGGNH